MRLAQKPDNAGKTVVVILPDSGGRYLSSIAEFAPRGAQRLTAASRGPSA